MSPWGDSRRGRFFLRLDPGQTALNAAIHNTPRALPSSLHARHSSLSRRRKRPPRAASSWFYVPGFFLPNLVHPLLRSVCTPVG